MKVDYEDTWYGSRKVDKRWCWKKTYKKTFGLFTSKLANNPLLYLDKHVNTKEFTVK